MLHTGNQNNHDSIEPDFDALMRRSKSIAALKKPGHNSLLMVDATNYYKQYDDIDDEENSISLVGNLVGECYIGFSKIL